MLTGNLIRFVDGPGTRQWWSSTDRRGLPKGAIAYIDNYVLESVAEQADRETIGEAATR